MLEEMTWYFEEWKYRLNFTTLIFQYFNSLYDITKFMQEKKEDDRLNLPTLLNYM